MRATVARTLAISTTGAAGFAVYDRYRASHISQRSLPCSSSLATASSASAIAPNRMSPGLVQQVIPSSGSSPAVAPSKDAGSDAMESMKAGVAGHAASLAGLARAGAAVTGIPPFETTFAVPMHCSGCARTAEGAVTSLAGIESASADVASGLLHVRGTAAPSAIVGALQAAGKDAILRGSGASNSAAVCILELDAAALATSGDGASAGGKSPVRGLARLVQVSPGHTLVDLTLSGLRPGTYRASIRQTGDISRGLKSLGAVWRGTEGIDGPKEDEPAKGDLGSLQIDESGRGAAYIAREMSVWEIIGRGMSIVEESADAAAAGEGVWGVLARSAGVWDNDKTVCSCSGKTVWDERVDQKARGIL